jgi:glycosyltransferase involved in cell wall biosynthesis
MNTVSRKPMLSIVLGTYNRKKLLKLTIESVRDEMKDFKYPFEIIVVDGGSDDGTLPWLVEQKDIIAIVQHNHGTWEGKPIPKKTWGYFMNLGFKSAQGKYVCMLSDDCLVVPEAIKNGYFLFEKTIKFNEKVGAIAFYWRNWPEQEEYCVGLTLGDMMFVNHGLYLTEALKNVDYIDEETYAFYHADGDLCLKMWEKGYTVIDSPNSFIEHYSHANVKHRKQNSTSQKNDWNNYLNRWEGIFYSRNEEKKGKWITKEYSDQFSVAKQFRRVIGAELSRIAYKVKGKLKHGLKVMLKSS